MHKNQQLWCESLKSRFPKYFSNNRILEIGSLDINGNNRYLFDNCEHIGIDVIEGNGVDVVSIAHKYKSSEKFDVVFSTNSIEHDIHYKKTIKKMYDLLVPGGLMFVTVPLLGEHGTLSNTPEVSGTSQMDEKWANFYKRFNKDLFFELFDEDLFETTEKKVIKGFDLTFFGIKLDKNLIKEDL